MNNREQPTTNDLLERYTLLLEAYAESLAEGLDSERLDDKIRDMETQLGLGRAEDVIGGYLGQDAK